MDKGMIFFGVFSIFLGVELLVRIRYFLEEQFDWKPFVKIRVEKELPKVLSFLGHPYALYTKRPNMDGLYPSNNLGYAGKRPLTPEKSPNKIRIYCIGGSTVEASDLEQGPDSHWPAKLQDILNERLGGERPHRDVVETVNAGVAGYTSAESLSEFLFRGLDLKSDFLLIYQNINDAWFPQMDVNFKQDYSHCRMSKPWKLSFWNLLPNIPFLYSYQVLRAILSRRLGNQNSLIYWISDPPIRAGEHFDAIRVEIFKRNTRNLIVTARAVGTEPILLKWERDWLVQWKPTLVVGTDDSKIKKLHLQYLLANNKALQELAEEYDCRYYEVGPFHAEYFLSDGIHFSSQGLDEMAKRVAESIFPQIESKFKGLSG
jgi:lysophospholipase L1-like esterase